MELTNEAASRGNKGLLSERRGEVSLVQLGLENAATKRLQE